MHFDFFSVPAPSQYKGTSQRRGSELALEELLEKALPTAGNSREPRVPRAQVSGLTEHHIYQLAKGLIPRGGSQMTTCTLLTKCSLPVTHSAAQ